VAIYDDRHALVALPAFTEQHECVRECQHCEMLSPGLPAGRGRTVAQVIRRQCECQAVLSCRRLLSARVSGVGGGSAAISRQSPRDMLLPDLLELFSRQLPRESCPLRVVSPHPTFRKAYFFLQPHN